MEMINEMEPKIMNRTRV